MRVMLINAPVWKYAGVPARSNPGMGLLYVGAVLREDGHEVRIIDAEAYGWWHSELLKEIEKWDPTHVGIGSLSQSLVSAIELCKKIKEHFPDKWVTMGGPGPSSCPAYTQQKSGCDNVTVGEAELVLKRSFSEVGITTGIPPEDLDSLPMAAYDLMEPGIGSSHWLGNLPRPPIDGEVRETVVMWSRGCPHPCTFCLPRGTKILTAGLLWKNIEDVVVGEKLIGLTDGRFNKKYSETLVTKTFERTSEILKITTEDGVVYSSPEHPWLTTHNRWIEASKLRVGWYMRKLSEPTEPPIENDSYKRGYLSGAIHGDGHIGHHSVVPGKKWIGHRFSLAGDSEMMDTTLKFFGELGGFEKVHRAKFNGGMYKHITSMICAYTKETVFRIEKMIDCEEDDDEYRKGFVAGMFDAEGSYSGSSLRISNLDVELLQRTLKYASHFGFEFKYEKNGVRLLGNMSESVRFFATFNPKVIKKKGNLLKRHIKNHTRIVSVESLPGIVDVYNLETTSENFVADGFVAHNCSKAAIGKGPTRRRGRESIVKELNYLNDRFKINSIFVYDDELIGMSESQNEWLYNVAHEINETSRLDIHFKGQGRCSEKFISRGVLAEMKLAGFFAMMMGCESGSENVKKRIKKGTSNDDIRITLTALNDIGLDVYGFWMVGMPEETPEEASKTEELIYEMAPLMKWLQVTVFSPLPGSELWDEALDMGWLCGDTEGIEERCNHALESMSTNFQTMPLLDMPWMSKESILKWQRKLFSAYEAGKRNYDGTVLGK